MNRGGVDGTDVEIAYEADIYWCPEHGDNWNSPRIEAHWEMDGFRPISVTVYADGPEREYSDTGHLCLAEHILENLPPETIWDGLAELQEC